ncbi:Cysteine protease ATG4C [Schistosoma japonicum]|nr:Cysteine protease ATG4C [Schistosoma japonicum]
MNGNKQSHICTRRVSRSKGSTSVTRSSFTPLDHIRSAWNQLKFGWCIHLWPNFDRSGIIYLLGRSYFASTPGNLKTIPKNIILDGNFSDFAADFASRLWFTYRDNFPPILRNPSSSSTNSAPHSLYTRRPVSCDCESIQAEVDLLNFPSAANRKSNHTISLSSHHIGSSPANILNSYVPLSVQTSDCGWGCMFRCGQMLLAQALVVHFLGRNWRLTKSQRKSDFNLQIIKWFNDSWSPFSPLSLHRLVHVSGRKPGEFCGPASVCAAILRVMAMGSALDSRLNQVQVYLARDRIIYREEIMDLARGSHTLNGCHSKIHFTDHTALHRSQSNQINDSHSFEPAAVLLLIPLMFGKEDRINPRYIELVLRLFSDPAFVGLIGGRRKHSSYYIGCQNKSLIYLDPHFTQPTQRLNSPKFSIDSWYCPIPKTMNAENLDPSCAIGFYCRTRGELSDLIDRLPILMSLSGYHQTESTESRPATCIVEVISLDETKS